MTKKPLLIASAVFAAVAATAVSACPDKTAYGDTYEFSGKELYSEKLFSVRAGGEYSITACGINPESERGRGYVISAPDFSFRVSGMSRYQLVISVISDCDSVLLINTASENWYYDDDDNGNLDARIVLTRPADGWLDVWVGTHDGAFCDAALALETFDK
jgi:hypothetical protein